MQAFAVIRRAIPEASDELCDHVLWGRTAYPFVDLTPRALYRAADRLRRAEAAGRTLCDHCDNQAATGRYMCASCAAALASCK